MRLCTFLQNHTLKIAFKAQCHPAKREGKPTGLLGEIRYIETRKRARERERVRENRGRKGEGDTKERVNRDRKGEAEMQKGNEKETPLQKL